MKRSIPILLYHHVSPDREITPQGFERQLTWLLEQGYESLSVSDLLPILSGARPASEKPRFVLTFDDGYLDNWLYAFPLLKKLSVKATIYLVTGRMENLPLPRVLQGPLNTRDRERETGGFLSWAEASAMSASGLIEFGSHTHTHRHFVRQTPYADLREELQVSKRLIETALNRPCDHLAWPWGDYETTWWPLVKEVGYQTAATTQAGPNAAGTHPLALKRFKVSREDTGWLAGRMRWNSRAFSAQSYALMYGWDRRFKTWLHSESPYAHG